MSVYTEVTVDDLKPLLTQYQAGELLSLEGIRDGIENTNYFVSTTHGEYVLTLFEHSTETEVDFALECMAHFAVQGLPCARPLSNQRGQYLQRLNAKPASLVTRLTGRSIHNPGPDHCYAVGQTLGQMHMAGQAIQTVHANPRGPVWRHGLAKQLIPQLKPDQTDLLTNELAQQQDELADLPHGVIHADLFCDNVLFDGTQLSGLIDLYNAGHDLLLYDLAITATDWCTQADGEFEASRLLALIKGYCEIRPVTANEQVHWPQLLRRAALRFWLSRLKAAAFPREGHLTQQKDPRVYEKLLRKYRQNPPKWPV